MNFDNGQLVIILAPFMDYEIYATVKQIMNENIILEMKADMEVPIGKEFLCIVVDNESVFEFYTQIDGRNGNYIFIKKPAVGGYSAIEKRKFTRVDCYIGFIATPTSINNIAINSKDKKFTGIIRNISGGGVMIESNLNLPKEMNFEFKLKLNFFMDCKAKIIRTEEIGKDIYHSGCEFIDNSIENIKNISLYTFKEKLKQKRRELNQRIPKGGKVILNGET
ncbi:MAG: PilZ domain [Clostridia bacterium]|jgi:hypothetical protein|nr:PilZ domain [Clostridia bacterium]